MKDTLRPVIHLIVVIWLGFLVQAIIPVQQYGIRPRSIDGLLGVVFAPVLHGGLTHITANTVSLFFIGLMVFGFHGRTTWLVLIEVWVLGGLGTWLIGDSNSLHIGASGVIYGLLGYSLFIGLFKKDFKNIVFSGICFFLYGGALWGLFPASPLISWEGHLCGFLSGILSAKVHSSK